MAARARVALVVLVAADVAVAGDAAVAVAA